MDLAHVHLFMNHIPFLGTAFALILLFFSMTKQNNHITKILLWCILGFAVVTIIVYLTGEPAEGSIEKFGIGEDIIEPHENAALISLILMSGTGLFALFGIYLMKGNVIKNWFKYSFLILSLITIISFARTANLGGEIRHNEIRTVQEVK